MNADRSFAARTYDMWRSHHERARAAGAPLNYTVGDLRAVVQAALDNPCPYCGALLHGANFSADHETPTSRGGSYGIGNVIICCRCCNQAKHTLDGPEFRALMALARAWPAPSRANLICRLRAGAKAIRKRS